MKTHMMIIISSSILLVVATWSVCSATHIYFGTDGGGIKSYSLATSAVTTVVESAEDLEGIAYDPINRKIYYASYNYDSRVYRANVDGTGIETLGSNVDFQYLCGIAVDWQTGNLYLVSSLNSNVFVCNATSSDLICTRVSTVGAYFSGIAVDPLSGEMFITGYFGIYRSQMDGSNFTQIVSGYGAVGIQLNSDSDQFYWADNGNDRIVSSQRYEIGVVENIAQLGTGESPWGLTTFNGSIYWGNFGSGSLQRSSPTGNDVVTIYDGTSPIRHLTLVP